jgi:hypothetical protein
MGRLKLDRFRRRFRGGSFLFSRYDPEDRLRDQHVLDRGEVVEQCFGVSLDGERRPMGRREKLLIAHMVQKLEKRVIEPVDIE